MSLELPSYRPSHQILCNATTAGVKPTVVILVVKQLPGNLRSDNAFKTTPPKTHADSSCGTE